jgi:hypothetical protein
MSEYKPVDADTYDELVMKCQENPWLSYGGFLADADESIDENPYEFCVTDSLDSLRLFFQSNYWVARQGIIYKNLAFIQQKQAGDEWWVLIKSTEGWFEIDSCSLDPLCEDKPRFESFICLLQGGVGELAVLDGKAARFEQALEVANEIANTRYNKRQILELER